MRNIRHSSCREQESCSKELDSSKRDMMKQSVPERTVAGAGRGQLELCATPTLPPPVALSLEAVADLLGLSAGPSVPVAQHQEPAALPLPDNTQGHLHKAAVPQSIAVGQCHMEEGAVRQTLVNS